MNKLKIYWLIGVILWMLPIYALTPPLDSLKQELSRAHTLEQNANLYNQITWAAYKVADDSTLFYAQKAFRFGESNDLIQPTLVAKLQLAEILRSRQDLEGAKKQLEESKTFFEQKPYWSEKTQFLLFMGLLELDQQEHEKAIEYLKEGYPLSLQYNLKLSRNFLIGLVDAYQQSGAMEAAEVFIKKKLESKNIKDSITVFNELGTSQARQQHYEAALPFYQQSLRLANAHKDYQGESRAALNIGNIHLIQGNWTKAIEYYTRSGSMKERLGDEAGLAILHNNIASIYKDQERYEESLEYYEKSRVFYDQKKDSIELANTWVNMAVINILQEKYQVGIELLKAALHILDVTKDGSTVLIAHLNIAFAYNEVGKCQLALNYLELAKKAAQKQDDLYSMNTIANLYGACYFYLKDYTKATNHYLEALRLGQELDLLIEQKTALFGLYETERYQSNYEASLDWLEQYDFIKDSLATFQTDRQLVELQEKYDTKQKEQEINRLNVENVNIELENQLKTKQFNLLLLSSIFVVLIMVFLSLLFYYRQRQQKIVLEHANELHKEKVNQLIDRQALTTLDAVLQTQQKERKSLAKDIHDTLGSFLATLKYQHEAGKTIEGEKEEEAQYKIMEGLISQSCDEVRLIAHQMATGERLNFNLMKAINDLIQRINNTQQFELNFNYFGAATSLPQEKELVLYRIVQELFSNVMKHAEASQATLQINKSSVEWIIILEDNGKGFNQNKMSDKGLGLASIAERVKELNGQLDIDTYVGRGTNVILVIPVDANS